MKKYVIPGGIILLVIIGAIWLNARKMTKKIPEGLEKCICGRCDLDIFNCVCPTAKKQREKLKRRDGD